MNIFLAIENKDLKSLNDDLNRNDPLLTTTIKEGRLSGATALTYASYLGYADVVKILLVKGADPNPTRKDDGIHSPLTIAMLEGHRDIVASLLAYGADPNIPAGPWQVPATTYERILQQQNKWGESMLTVTPRS